MRRVGAQVPWDSLLYLFDHERDSILMVIFRFDEWVCKSVPPKLPVFKSAAAPGYFELLPAQERLVELFDRRLS